MIESKDDFGLEATETCDAAVIGFESSMLEPSKSPVEAEVNTDAFGVSALLDDAGEPPLAPARLDAVADFERRLWAAPRARAALGHARVEARRRRDLALAR